MRDLSPIVEMQAVELKRLMRDKDRLNRRIDALIEEISWLREMQQQDQSLREKEQALRFQMQETVNDLIQRTATPSGKPVTSPARLSATAKKRPDEAEATPEKTTLVRRDNNDPPPDTIPSFLLAEPTTAGDGEAPIKKLMTRIKARQAQA